MNSRPISEDELQAYVDDALPGARHAAVDDYLARHPADADRLRAYQAQKRALQALFKPVLDEMLPETLRALAKPPQALRAAEPERRPAFLLTRWSLQRLAAGVLIALLSGVAGWLAHGEYLATPSLARLSPLPRQAAVAHAVFSPDLRRPVEVGAEHEDQLVAWLSKRLGTPVHPPRLAGLGFDLVGGRLLPGNSGPVAQFMYQDAGGQRLTLYVSTENAANEETSFRFAQEGKVNVFYWIDGKFGYALSASIDRDELARVGKAVYEQIEGR